MADAIGVGGAVPALRGGAGGAGGLVLGGFVLGGFVLGGFELGGGGGGEGVAGGELTGGGGTTGVLVVTALAAVIVWIIVIWVDWNCLAARGAASGQPWEGRRFLCRARSAGRRCRLKGIIVEGTWRTAPGLIKAASTKEKR
jgi:hypothetical protein